MSNQPQKRLQPINILRLQSDFILLIDEPQRPATLYLTAFLKQFSPVPKYLEHEASFRELKWEIQEFAKVLVAVGDGPTSYNRRLVGKTLKLLRIFSRSDQISQFLSTTSPPAVTFAYRSMQHFPSHVDIHVDSIALLANLSISPVSRELLRTTGCIPDILSIMSKWRGSSAVQAEICAALSNLSTYDEYGQLIASARGVGLILGAIREHARAEDLQVQAYQALWSLGRFVKESLGAAALHAAVTKTLDEWRGSAAVCTAVCNCLGRLFYCGYRFPEGESISAVWTTPTAAAEEAEEVGAASAPSSWLSSSSPMLDEIVARVVECIERFEANALLQVTASFCLGHLASCWVPRTPALAAAILRSLIAGIRRHAGDCSVTTTAAFALSSFLASNDNLRKLFLNLNGIETLLQTMLAAPTTTSADCGGGGGGGSGGEIFALETTMWVDDEGPNPDEPPVSATARRAAAEAQPERKAGAACGAARAELFQLFGAICVMHLNENADCRKRITAYRGIHAVYQAARMLSESKTRQLQFILQHVFRRLTNATGIAYVRPRGCAGAAGAGAGAVASLKELARNVFLRGLYRAYRRDESGDLLDDFVSWLVEEKRHMMLPLLIEDGLEEDVALCVQCRELCLPSVAIARYELTKAPKPVEYLCSKQCLAEYDPLHAERTS
ncbi:armadillo-type protein [Zopfochytrium polystomum]|nr:armadillo-type protein [Zopfochytrium polystomum]